MGLTGPIIRVNGPLGPLNPSLVGDVRTAGMRTGRPFENVGSPEFIQFRLFRIARWTAH
jgi:hypothetical protein